MKSFKAFLALLSFVAFEAVAQVPISNLPPATTPLTGSEVMILNQNSLTRRTPISSLTSIVPPITAPFVLQSASPTLINSRVLTGTADEVIVTDGGPLGNLTLATPQPIGTLNNPTFAGLTLTGLTGILIGHGASPLTVFGGVTCVNQFMRSLSSVGVGVCNSVANADLVNSSVTYNGVSVALGGSGTLTLASSNFANQGTTTTVLHGNAAGNPAWAQVNLAADVTNVLPAPNGGTGNGSYLLGDILYASTTTALSRLAGNSTSVKQFLTQTGTGAASAAPVWGTIAASDLPGSFAGFANPTASAGLLAVNGSATTAMRSDAAPPISQSISPTWTGTHIFSGSSPLTILNAATAAADTKNWDTRLSSAGNWALSTATDLSPNTPVKDALAVARTGTAISSITLGNTTDNPVTTAHGGVIVDSTRPAVSSGTSSIVLGASSGGVAQEMWVDSAGAADSKIWDIFSDTNSFNLRASNDANNSATTWLRALRSGLSITSVSVGGPFVSAGATSGVSCPTAGGSNTASNCFTNAITGHASWAMAIQPTGGAGNDLGLIISAGNSSNSTDVLLRVDTQPATNVLTITGDGAVLAAGVSWKFSGVGTTASAANAFLDNANSNNLLRSTSSRRYKTDISTMSDVASDIVYKLRPVRFHSLASADDHRSWFYGLVAEEVAAVEPSLVVKDPEGRPDGVQYDRVQVFMLPAVQSLHKQVQWLWLCIVTLASWNAYLTLGGRRVRR